MKKILTFLMMFAMTAGILSAQNTNLSYQVVVRDANNNLVVNQKVNVEVVIMANSQNSQEMVDVISDFPEGIRHEEVIEDSTNANGMLTLSIGQNGDNPFTMMDWSTAVIYLKISNLEGEVIMNVEEPVYAVPYAAQAGFMLTTQQMVDYLTNQNGDTQDAEDVNAIWAALKENPDMLGAIRDVIADYVKNHFDIAKKIARHYMHQVSGADVREAYDHVMALDPSVKQAIVNNVKRYLKNHRDLALELAKYYVGTASDAEIQTLYNKLITNNEVYPFIQDKVDAVLTDYLRTHGLDPACLTNNHFDNLCDLQAAAASMNNDPNDTCPRIISFANTANDGLMALALNGGIIMTAYVKNYSTSKVSGYGIDLYATGETTPTARPNVHYVSLNGNFGKLVDTMAQTGYCRNHLNSRAYLTLKADHPCATSYTYPSTYVTEKTDEYDVPGYTFTIEREGNTLKVVFTPNEAQQFFSSQKPNNIQWFVDDATTPAATGMTFELPANFTTVRAHAYLRDCTYDATYPNN